ncbi:histone PARylation factor 1 isoform X2 [Rana temporaria]|uniref:histone PARylation factor 1 isoform X2 n=1 Tax=Rana temporaria TaxID=8407 RepID=UPI001AACFF42|nr:histone PARylation factor 1 isoform X2 [Rana temporaria]
MTSRQAGAVRLNSDMAGGGKRRTAQDVQQSSDTGKEDVKKRRSDQSDVPTSLRQEVECLYKLTMPEDFYTFWTFCAEIDPKTPSDVLKDTLGLQLVGPYDIISGKHASKKNSDVNYNLHWRFFYDPPEFQTIIDGDSRTQFHMGYYRDSPEEMPVFVGTNEAVKGCLITPSGDNVFSAVKLFATKKLKEVSDKNTVATIKGLIEKLTAAADKLGYSMEQKSNSMKRRNKKVVTKSFHGAGLVVPVDKNDVGYRELPETDGNLKKICKAIVEAPTDDVRMKAFAPIQEIITFVQFANDECDYGMGYELGIDLFCYGSHYFHKVARQLLPLAYKLLKRNLFAEIIESHLANRKKDQVNQLDA